MYSKCVPENLLLVRPQFHSLPDSAPDSAPTQTAPQEKVRHTEVIATSKASLSALPVPHLSHWDGSCLFTG